MEPPDEGAGGFVGQTGRLARVQGGSQSGSGGVSVRLEGTG